MPEIKSLYYIADVVNICSIIDQGILSHNGVKARGVEYNIPLYTEMLMHLPGEEKVKWSNPFSSVVAGLALQAGRSTK